MLRNLFWTVVLVIAIGVVAPPAFGQDAAIRTQVLAGTWTGAVETPGGPLAITLQLMLRDTVWTGTISVPALTVENAPIRDIVVGGDSISFPLPDNVRLSGEFKPETQVIRGTIEHGERSWPFTLARPGSEIATRIARNTNPACELSKDPNQARLVTADIEHFWDAFERAAPNFPAGPFKRLYFGRATRGLRDFILLRIGSAEKLADAVRTHEEYYASIREPTRRIQDLTREIRASFTRSSTFIRRRSSRMCTS